MRWLDVPIASFTGTDGVSRNVHDMRDIEQFSSVVILSRNAADDFDEIASRGTVYGDGGESQAYKVHEANIADIYDNLLEYGEIRKVKVPV